MDNQTIFKLVNVVVLPMWLLLIAFPSSRLTGFLIKLPVIPLLLAVTYVFIVVPSLSNADYNDFTTLAGLKKLFGTDEAVLAGWIHYLCFDLAVGMWLVVQNRTVGISKWLMIPVLLFTFMMGPAGFLLFHLFRVFKR
jgi:hypothetical protein